MNPAIATHLMSSDPASNQALVAFHYATCNPNTVIGQGQRILRFLRPGTVSETHLGHETDMRPGWWAVDPDVWPEDWDTEKKFFRDDRILDAAIAAQIGLLSSDTSSEDEEAAVELPSPPRTHSPGRGASPQRSPPRSRSRSRSPTP
jgi:hypothetical protein